MEPLFREGGPHQVRRTGGDKYEMQITIPVDEDGMTGRECPDEECSPAYFKVKGGTGIVGAPEPRAFCPYCRRGDHANSFTTKEQVAYGRRVVENEVLTGMDRMFGNALGVGPSGKKKLGGGLVSIEMSYSSPRRPAVSRPLEEELRRDLTCPKCTLVHAVFGLATWCPDCGTDIFLTHVEAELDVIRRMLADIPRRAAELGVRVAAKDVENALEDLVSIFETVLKLVTRRALRARGRSSEEVDEVFRKTVRTNYQGVKSSAATFESVVGVPLLVALIEAEFESLHSTFEKRHPITHNLGVVDRKYIEKVRSGELEGREIRVTKEEVEGAIELATRVLTSAYERATNTAENSKGASS